MDTWTVLCIISVAFTGFTAGSGVLPDGPLIGAVGGSVKFNTTVTPTTKPFIAVTWTIIIEKEEIPIITATTINVTNSNFKDRIIFFTQTGSLELSKLALNDSGEYRVVIITNSGNQLSGTTTLQTLVPVSNATLKVNSTDLVEFNSTVHLSCSSFGSSPSFQWLNGSTVILEGDTVQLTDGGATLTLAPVTRYDHGLFKCRVFNAINEVTSEPVHLSVSFGPDNTYFQVSPLQEYIAEGSNVTLSCSALSRPLALFTWFVDRKKLLPTGSKLLLTNIQENQSGNYSCLSFNGNTLRQEISQPSPINVLKKISNISIKPSSQPIEGRMLNLTCDSAGSVFFRQWTKNGLVLVPDKHITLHDKDTVLSFHTVNRSDSAPYSCRISNPINNEEVTYDILVNYGPDSVQIVGPSQINVKQTLTLNCFAESVPFANYTRTSLNQTELHNSSTLVKTNVNFSDGGSYICSASNNITGKTVSAVHILTVTDEPVNPCSGGCIAGILVACLIVCAAVSGGVYYIYHNRKHLKNHPSENTSTRTDFSAGDEVQETTAEIKDDEDMNYAQLGQFYLMDNGKVKLKVQDKNTEYAEIRLSNGPPSYEAHVQRMKSRAHQQLKANEAQVSAPGS
ncbi:cell adhesion molecule CEACAM20-like [Stigmatopora nigra]